MRTNDPKFNLPPGVTPEDLDPEEFADEFEREIELHEWKQEVENDDKATA
jgi:hypothetical protein